MRIAICDDEKLALEQTSDIVEKVFQEMKLNYSMDLFINPGELLKNKSKYDLIFLDIELNHPSKNGVWVAKNMKSYNPDCIIIFTTDHEEYIDDVIEKYAFRYWSKPIDSRRLNKSIQSVLERMQTIEVEIFNKVNNTKQTIELPLRNIVYITPQSKHCKMVTTEGEYVITGSFKEFRARLTKKNFCDCHGSYCVNLDYVDRYTKTDVYLKYNTHESIVYMSRRQYTAFKEQMFIVGGEKI